MKTEVGDGKEERSPDASNAAGSQLQKSSNSFHPKGMAIKMNKLGDIGHISLFIDAALDDDIPIHHIELVSNSNVHVLDCNTAVILGAVLTVLTTERKDNAVHHLFSVSFLESTIGFSNIVRVKQVWSPVK